MPQKLTMKDMHILAKCKGIRCVSMVYVDSKTKLEWECPFKHTWLATHTSIKSGVQCPKCSKIIYISEERCRYIIEKLTGYRFLKTRTILGNRQEIDGFSDILKIGFEYQGEQHYRKTRKFSEEEFQNTQKMDRRKKTRIRKLKKSGKIRDIIFIKYTQKTSDKKLTNYIIKQLNKIDPSLIKNTKVNWSGFYKYLSPLNEIREIVEKRDGKLIDEKYIDSETKIIVDCGKGHIFETTSHNLKKDRWCPYCYGNAKLNIEYIRKFANQHNGACDSDVYTNNKTKMKWRCLKCGCRREISYNTMQNRKYFCKTCRLEIIR